MLKTERKKNEKEKKEGMLIVWTKEETRELVFRFEGFVAVNPDWRVITS